MRKLFISLGLTSALLFGGVTSTFAADNQQQTQIQQIGAYEYLTTAIDVLKKVDSISTTAASVLQQGNLPDNIAVIDASITDLDGILNYMRSINPPERFQFMHTIIRSMIVSEEKSFQFMHDYISTGDYVKLQMAQQYIKAAQAFSAMLVDEINKQSQQSL